MKFIQQKERGPSIEFEISDDSTLDEVLDSFQAFLRGCGYYIDYDKIIVVDYMD